MSPELAMLLAPLIPAVAAVGVAACHRAPNLREAVTLTASALLILCVMSLVGPVAAGATPVVRLFETLPGLSLEFRIEPLGMLFALVASCLWLVSSVYSIGYMRGNDEAHQTRFFVCFALAIAATMGIALAGNLITLFLYYELLTLVTYPLVTHHGDDAARRGGRVYLGVLLFSSILLFLPAVIATWALAGTLEFVPGGILAGKVSGTGAMVLLALYMFGIGKAALMPMHRWLPSAMVAPTPVSALLHAVAVVKAGVFTVVKVVVYVFGIHFDAAVFAWLPWVAGFTIIAASLVALRADNLKRRLAYSTVSQLSYIVLAASLLAPLSVIGAALHIVAHAVGKITLFFAAGAIYTAAHKTDVSQLDGIGRRMPWTLAAFGIASLSMIGLPPAVGFVSKWYMVAGALQAHQWMAIAVILVSTLLNAGYFLPIVYRGFFVRPDPNEAAHGEAPWPMVAAMVATAALTIGLFFYADLPLRFARMLVGG
ncbi:MAG: monovalent cation/H+ antiporter subunit D family protein [Betaproteobacteria bacterium]|nr:monovalent cation/H+ antiporter subunit D family protein [Betaproteobacteria bacterium]